MPASTNNAPGGRISGTKLGDPEKAQKECTEIEADLAELHAAFEQYFLGQERRPPTERHVALKKRMAALRTSFVNSTSVKFRVGNLQQRMSTFERLWERTLLEIENGTYKRDVFKARRHVEQRKKPKEESKDASLDEDLDLSDLSSPSPVPMKPPGAVPSIAPLVPHVAEAQPKGPPSITPTLPVTGSNPAFKPGGGLTGINAAFQPGAKPPGSTGSTPAFRPGSTGANAAHVPAAKPVGTDGGLNDQKVRAIYDAYVMAKKRCGEDTSKLSLESVATTLRSQVPSLMKQHNAKTVEFKVVIKDGKAVLRALPKE